MCGIWALFGVDFDPLTFWQAFQSVCHRGPNSFRLQSVNLFEHIMIGFHRLSIVDKSGSSGTQPIISHDLGQILTVVNGMIYNYKELSEENNFDLTSHCDIEPINHLYAKMGMVNAAAQLDGVFSGFLVDTKNMKVFLFRDTFGVRPSFYFFNEETGSLMVASEAKGITTALKSVGYKGCENIQPVLPGCVVEFDLKENGRVSNKNITRFNAIGESPKYTTLQKDLDVLWTLPGVPLDKDYGHGITEEVLAKVRTVFLAAVKKRLLSERKIGCLLSGGLDSSIVTSLVVKLMREEGITYPIDTFSIGCEGSPDVIAARKVAEYLQTNHHEVIITPEESCEAVINVIKQIESYDITTIRASVGMYLVCKYVKEKTDTIILYSGEGSDELLQGYIYFHQAPTVEEAANEGLRLLNDLYFFDVLRCDRTVSAWGLDVRVPFLDHRFTSYILSLPPEARRPVDGVEKWLLRKAFSGTGILPDEILWRTKEAFSDGIFTRKRSFYHILQEFVENKISDEDLSRASQRFPHNPPHTKESYYYRSVFEEFYPGMGKMIPYYWMPKWCETNDPSARTLQHYSKLQNCSE